MKVQALPAGLRSATRLLLLAIPIAALETALAARAPWWRLPWSNVGLWAGACALMIIPMIHWLRSGQPWAWGLLLTFGAVWTVLTAWVAFRMRNPGLAYFGIALGGYFYLALNWLARELSRSYFDPRLRWYQGLPEPLPGVTCWIRNAESDAPGPVSFQVSRLDRDGAFVFFRRSDADANKAIATHSPELVFKFRDHEVSCPASPRRVLIRGTGAGFQFRTMSADRRKALGDFVEQLKGEGYAL